MVAPDLRHPRRSQAEIPLIDLSEFGQPPLIIEIYQSEPAMHIYRRGSGHWVFEPVGGLEAMLELRSVALTIPLAEIYRYIDFDQEEAEL
jgi:hypothetical protein